MIPARRSIRSSISRIIRTDNLNIVCSLFLAGLKEHLVFTRACFLIFSGLLLVDVTKKGGCFHKETSFVRRTRIAKTMVRLLLEDLMMNFTQLFRLEFQYRYDFHLRLRPNNPFQYYDFNVILLLFIYFFQQGDSCLLYHVRRLRKCS